MSAPITFALIDDKQEELKKLTQQVERLPNMKVVYSTQKEEQLFNYLARCAELPDFIIVDIKFGDYYKAGYKIVENLHEKYPDINLLLCSEYPDESYNREVIAKGSAKGLVKKQDLKFNLQRAIEVINSGREYWLEVSKDSYIQNTAQLERESAKRLQEEQHNLLSPAERKQIKKADIVLSKEAIHAYLSQCSLQLNHQLTVQQWQIFKLLAMGHTANEVIEKLSTTSRNLHTQKGNIRERLEISGQGDVWFLIKALELGVVAVREFVEKQAAITILK